MKTELYFFIEPYIYIKILEKDGLLLNCLTQDYIIISNTKILAFIEKTCDNNRIINLEEEDRNDAQLNSFIQLARKKGIADLVSQNVKLDKPIQLSPFLKLYDQKNSVKYSEHKRIDNLDQNRLKKEKLNWLIDSRIGDHIMETLNELNIFVNNNHPNSKFDNVFKQFLFPQTKINCNLDILLIEKMLKETENSFQQINIIGNHLCEYPDLFELSELLNTTKKPTNLYFQYNEGSNLLSNNWFKESKKFMWITFPLDLEQGNEIFSNIDLYNSVTCLFLVMNKAELNSAIEIIDKKQIANFRVYPISFNNEVFCKKFLTFKIKELLKSTIREKDIYINQILNRSNFGSISVLNNGSIFANLNDKPLGTVNDNSLQELTFKELKYGISWKRTRNDIDPCRECIFCDICPPISNTEIASQKYDYCNIDKFSNGFKYIT